MRLLEPGQFIVKVTKSGMEFFYFESGKCLEKYGISSVQMWRNPVLACDVISIVLFVAITWSKLGLHGHLFPLVIQKLHLFRSSSYHFRENTFLREIRRISTF